MNEPARARRPSPVVVLFVLLVVFVAVAADRYVVLHARLRRLERASEHTTLALARLEARRLTRSDLARVEGAWSVRLATLSAREKRLARTVDKLRALGHGRRAEVVAVAEARELLAFARDENRIAARPRATVPLLVAAARLLASVSDPALTAAAARLREAVALRARLPGYPYARARAALDRVRRGLDRWPASPSVRPRVARPPSPTVHGFWAKIWSAVVRFVHATVRIERIPAHGTRLLSRSERARVREGLRLDLATARLALDARDPGLFRTLATSVLRRVPLLYDVRNPAVMRALKTLRALVARPLPTRPPSLAPVRRALASAEKALLKA